MDEGVGGAFRTMLVMMWTRRMTACVREWRM